ncbi:hypothetical protein [Microbacterium sp. p3-SID336]|uniref:hypothetical protein n=1 Tax=Microbacterium sp. p3-SID336 TaxID=2916212 RepID=UPI0021A29557|nr:hypothetical protein [Microbacterium sp. p3-SID336]MCT1478316.1 hypothetical protein [Microbacterium sp. p3-SID336]
MANECYNRFEITAPTEHVTSLHELLTTAPKNGDADGWLDALNVLLATDATTGIRDDAFYDSLEDEEKRYPFDTEWTLTDNEDGSSTLGWVCFTKWFGYNPILCPLLDFLETNCSLIRFEYLECEPATSYGYWVAFSRDRNGSLERDFSREVVESISEDDVQASDEVKFFNPTGYDLEDYYPILMWDDGTFTDITYVDVLTVLPLTPVNR